MGREIRRVPANWNHPRQTAERVGKPQYRGMLQGDFAADYAEWERDLGKWFANKNTYDASGEWLGYNGKMTQATEEQRTQYPTWELFAGAPPNPPNPYDYMPTGDWYQLFETVSEGSPLSPPFATAQELVDWLATNRDFWNKPWTRAQAEAIVSLGFAPSGIVTGGAFYESQEAAELIASERTVASDRHAV
jgi:hypothetical protein